LKKIASTKEIINAMEEVERIKSKGPRSSSTQQARD
jgi:hypothetical protein